MRKIRRSKPDDEWEVNITPMLDIVFIMLIFFIVTASFVQQPGIDPDRPFAQTAVTKERGNILIAVSRNDEVWMNNARVALPGIRQRVEAARLENPEGSVVIVADEAASTGMVLDLMDNVRAAGVTNIAKAKSLRLGDFDEADMRALLAQHTTETGQRFTEDALTAVWNQTQGQPWLVNALADQACFEDETGRDRSRVIDGEAVMAAREELVLGRRTHLHQLADKLGEERVRRVVEPVLSGSGRSGAASPDDVEYVRDLGLLAPSGTARIANPIYREVIPRELMYAREGIGQTLDYVDRCRAESGHLVVFDHDESKPWEAKLYRRDESEGGRPVTVWGA